jgi:hypothetical protein
MFRREGTAAERRKPMNPSTPIRQPWTVDQQEKLDELLEAGKTVIEIAPILQRSRLAIYARLQRNYRKQKRKPSARWPGAI